MKHDLVIYEATAPADCPTHGKVKDNMIHRVYDSGIGKTYLLCNLCIEETVLSLVRSGERGQYNVIDRRNRGRADSSGSDGENTDTGAAGSDAGRA